MPRTDHSLVSSPIRTWRTAQHLTLEEASHGASVSHHVWYLTECGCFTKIPPNIYSYIQSYSPVPMISTWYAEWIIKRRAAATLCETLPKPNLDKEPVAAWVEFNGYTTSKFSKQLCIQPSAFYKLRKRQVQTLPEQLIQALQDNKLSESFINELRERYSEYYDRQYTKHSR